MFLVGRSALRVGNLGGLGGEYKTMPSSSRKFKSPGVVVTDAGAGTGMLWTERLVSSVRQAVRVATDGLALSSSSMPSAETLQLAGESHVWPAWRQERIRHLVTLSRPSAEQWASLSEWALS